MRREPPCFPLAPGSGMRPEPAIVLRTCDPLGGPLSGSVPAHEGSWLIRRLSPDSNPIDIQTLPMHRNEQMLLSMGAEAVNVHLGSKRQAPSILKDLRTRNPIDCGVPQRIWRRWWRRIGNTTGSCRDDGRNAPIAASYAATALVIGWPKQHVTPTTLLSATMPFNSSLEVSLFAYTSNRVRDLHFG